MPLGLKALFVFIMGLGSISTFVVSMSNPEYIYLGHDINGVLSENHMEDLQREISNFELFSEIFTASVSELEALRLQRARTIAEQNKEETNPTPKGSYWSQRGWVQRLECLNAPYFAKPIRTSLTSRYGRRQNPFNGRRHVHAGVDFRGRVGTPVLASSAGKVRIARKKGRYGKAVIIDHRNGFSTTYGHLSGYAVKAGDRVNQGQTIGYVGRTGRVTGPHLHFEVRCNKVPVNPVVYLERKGRRALVSLLKRNRPKNYSYSENNSKPYVSRKVRMLRRRQQVSIIKPGELRSGAF